MAKETHSKDASTSKNQPHQSNEEMIGYHKGSIAVLSKEREEMIRIAQITEQLLQMHMKALADLGVDVKQFANEQAKQSGTAEHPKKKVPIENLI